MDREKGKDREGTDEEKQQGDNEIGGEKWVSLGKRWLLLVAGFSLWHLLGNSFQQQATKQGFRMITGAYGERPAPSVCRMVGG